MSPSLRVVVVAWLLASGTLQAAPPVTAIAYLEKAKLIAVGTRGQVTLHDRQSFAALETLGGQDERVTVIHDDGRHLFVASGVPGKSGVVRQYARGKNVPLRTVTAHTDIIYAMDDRKSFAFMATAGYDRTVKIWNTNSLNLEQMQPLKDHSDTVYGVAFHPNSELLATGSADRSIKIWDTAGGKRLFTLSESTDWVYAVAWHPDGKRLYGAGVDKSLRMWDVTKDGGKLVTSVFAHEAAVKHILIDSVGKQLFTVGEDRVIKSWDPLTLKERKTFPAQPETITAAALRADGKQLALGLFDGRTLFLDPETGKQVLPAKATEPKITSIEPNSFRRGQSIDAVVTGTDLDELVEFKQSDSLNREIKVQLLNAKSDTPTSRSIRVTLDRDQLLIGPAELKPIAVRGPLPPVRVWFDRFAPIPEVGSTDSPSSAMTIELPRTVVGTLDRSGDVDYFRFEAKAGDQLGVSLITPAPSAKFDPVLTLLGTDGEVLVERQAFVLGRVLPTDGVYTLALRDVEYRGGPELAYRLHVGPIPIVTGVFPLGVTKGQPTEVRMRGVNLPAIFSVPVSVTADQAVGTRRMAEQFLPHKPNGLVPQLPSLIVGEFPSVVHEGSETKLTALPHTVDGLLDRPGAVHRIRFPAKKGQRLMVEVEAARLGSALDSTLEILDAAGKPVPTAVLRCTAKAYTTFRDHDSNNPGIRLESWNDFGIDDFLYTGTQLMRIAELPKGPDDDCRFVAIDGKRVAHLGTTAQQVANGSAIYRIEKHPPGINFPPNGLPLFTLMARNDDGGPAFGKDSFLSFDPPADGEYVAVICDAAGAGSMDHAYRLTIREPRPAFAVRVSTVTPKVWKNGGITVGLTVTRTDEFQGPIRIRAVNVPAAFRIPDVVVEADQATTTAPIHDTGMPNPAQGSAAFEWVAEAEINGSTVSKRISGGTIAYAENPDLTTTVAEQTLTLMPGGETRLKVAIERKNGFTARVPLEVRGLPHGVRVMNIGLSGILIVPGQTDREIVLYAEPWVKPMSVPMTVLSRSERKGSEHAAPVVTLTVSAANAAMPKP